MKKSIKLKLAFGAILFIALFVMNGMITTKNSNGDITLSQLAISNADFSESNYPCGSIVCQWDSFFGRCDNNGFGPICYCYCETYIA